MNYTLTFVAVCALLLVYDWVGAHDREVLASTPITQCRSPSNTGEKLVATLYKSADGGPVSLHCEYHSTLAFAP